MRSTGGLASALFSIGDDLNAAGREHARAQLQREIVQDRYAAKLAEIEARYANRGMPPEIQQRIVQASGLDMTPKTQADFQRDANPVKFDDEGQPLPPAMVPDEKAYEKYRRGQQRAALTAGIALSKPEALDNLARFIEQQRNELLEQEIAEGQTDPHTIGRARAALKGQGEYDQGTQGILNRYTGEQRDTPKTRSEIRENDAQAHRARVAASSDVGNRVHSVVPAGDGYLRIVFRDGRSMMLRDSGGKPLSSKDYATTRRQIEQELMRDPLMARDPVARTAEVDKIMQNIYPQHRPGAGTGGGHRPSLDSFFRN